MDEVDRMNSDCAPGDSSVTCSVTVIGQSYEGRDLKVLTVSKVCNMAKVTVMYKTKNPGYYLK